MNVSKGKFGIFTYKNIKFQVKLIGDSNTDWADCGLTNRYFLFESIKKNISESLKNIQKVI